VSGGEARPGHEAAGRQGVAAFDFDGTLVRGDSFLPFLVRAVGARAFVRTVAATSVRLTQAYRRDGRDGAKARLVQCLLAGYRAEQLTAVGQGHGVRLARRVRPTMAEQIAWHRRRGHLLVMVSASLDVYLAPAAQMLGFDQVLATRLEVGGDGLLTGRLSGANVRGVEKSARLQGWLDQVVPGGRWELWAYGDSDGDRELLGLADHPVWLR
jgi:phosphatidylglycerophosphatase C